MSEQPRATPVPTPVPVTEEPAQPTTVKQTAYEMAAARGWAAQWPAIDALISHESGWIVGRMNTGGSGACGLGQALPCSKMGAAYGNPAGEIQWAYDYIAQRYGNPSNAWSFWQCVGQCGNVYKTATWY